MVYLITFAPNYQLKCYIISFSLISLTDILSSRALTSFQLACLRSNTITKPCSDSATLETRKTNTHY